MENLDKQLWTKVYALVDGIVGNGGVKKDSERLDEIESLLVKGANPNSKDGNIVSLLSLVSGRGRQDLASLLISYGSDVDISDRYQRVPLMSAIMHFTETSSAHMIEFLIKKGANVNKQDEWGDTPFYQFARKPNSCCSTLKLFLEAGIDTSLCHQHGNIIELLKNEAPEDTVAMIESYFARQENKLLEATIRDDLDKQDGMVF